MQPYYDDGTCTIYHADCRELLPELTADVLVTDPPYGIAHRPQTGNWKELGDAPWQGQQIAGDEDTALRDHVLAWWGDRPALVFGVWIVPRPGNTRALLVWDKGPAAGGGSLTMPWKASFEDIYVLGQGFSGHRGEGVLKGFAAASTHYSKGRSHPNEKPVTLLRALIGKCPPGVVLDPFMGSGTTLRAAKDLGRRAIGIEIEERYCEIAAKRLGQEVLDLSGVV